MSSQRTVPASFSRLKEMLPAPAAPGPETVVLEPLAHAETLIQQPYIPPVAPPPAVPLVAAPAPFVQPVAVQPRPASAAPSRSALAARPGKRLQHTKPATFRLPIELLETLKDVAGHNNLNMTDIVAEAVWLHLDSFEWPSGLEPSRELLTAHFAAPARR